MTHPWPGPRTWPRTATPTTELAAQIVVAAVPEADPMAMPPPIPYEPQPVTDRALVGTEHDHLTAADLDEWIASITPSPGTSPAFIPYATAREALAELLGEEIPHRVWECHELLAMLRRARALAPNEPPPASYQLDLFAALPA